MEHRGEWRIDENGKAYWHDGLSITDEGLKIAYRQNMLVEFMVEQSAIMGVKVGMA
jgi:hypothetical protein